MGADSGDLLKDSRKLTGIAIPAHTCDLRYGIPVFKDKVFCLLYPFTHLYQLPPFIDFS